MRSLSSLSGHSGRTNSLRRKWFAVPVALCLAGLAAIGGPLVAIADGPADNKADQVRPVPPPGIALPDADKDALTAGLQPFQTKLDELQKPQTDKRAAAFRKAHYADVAVLFSAVKDAIAYGEFFNPNDIAAAKSLVQLGVERAGQLQDGKAPWDAETGLVVRGYQSKIDGSYQPYGLVIPANYNVNGTDKVRLDIWCHGRGETLSEVSFLGQRRTQVGQISPPNTIVLHLYGRYCNANKLAGEIDCLEALAAVQSQYRIDEDRIVMRGFSMGGAAAWQFAVHYTDLFAAAAPGAGFSETPDFLKVFQKETLTPTPYEQTLWHMYDCPDWCLNLAQLPTIAYSGENDSQKQAADIMEAALAKEKIQLIHLIGPKTGHSYHPEAAAELERRLASIVAKGRNRIPKQIDFVTYSLRYNHMHWVQVDGLANHWQQARISATLDYLTPDVTINDPQIVVNVKNVTDFTLAMEPGWFPHGSRQRVTVLIRGQQFELRGGSDYSFNAKFHFTPEGWKLGARPVVPNTLRKQPGLQGPIDDAFLDSFMFVKGTGKSPHDKVNKWVDAESTRAVDHWRKQFRGHARLKNDTDIKDEDIAAHNLVLWGDPSSNAILAKIADKLPIKWDAKQITVGGKTYASDKHVPVLIYPNPLNPKKYVVLNSGFTFRDYDYLNNARQVPKLPDWAVVDLDTPPNPRTPGKIVAADFFNEEWQLSKP
ncbi:MAG: prolyl oligopeptidase family serine peptidase [Planctomycetota bacterium]